MGRLVAIDTETMGLKPERDRLCVVQLSSGDGTAHCVRFAKNSYDAPNLKKLLADPKTLFYFVALLPQFIDPAGDVGLQVTILAVTSVVIELGVLLAYGLAAGRLNRFARSPRFARWTDRVAGSFLIAAGFGMAAIRQND